MKITVFLDKFIHLLGTFKINLFLLQGFIDVAIEDSPKSLILDLLLFLISMLFRPDLFLLVIFFFTILGFALSHIF